MATWVTDHILSMPVAFVELYIAYTDSCEDNSTRNAGGLMVVVLPDFRQTLAEKPAV